MPAARDSTTAACAIAQKNLRRFGPLIRPGLPFPVPGARVSNIDKQIRAIEFRGSSSRFSGKLPALKGGRSLYNRPGDGVNRDCQISLLRDIEQSERIRGPTL